MADVKNDWKAGDVVTSAAMNAVGDSVNANTATNIAQDKAIEQNKKDIAANAEADAVTVSNVAAAMAAIEALSSKFATLSARVTDLAHPAAVAVEVANGYNDATVDAMIADATVSAKTAMTAKSFVMKNTTLSSASMNVTATGDVDMIGVGTTGDVARATMGNAQLSVHADGYIRITEADFAASGYNGIEIGLSTGTAKGIVIDGIDFQNKLSNNAISIFGTADNAVITISNCHFAEVSNILRISNRTNAKNVMIRLINCTCDKWETREGYQGMVICQDYTSGAGDVLTNNLFAPEKITIEIINCVGPNGKIVAPEDMSTVVQTGKADQLVYACFDNGTPAWPDYDASRLPTVVIK